MHVFRRESTGIFESFAACNQVNESWISFNLTRNFFWFLPETLSTIWCADFLACSAHFHGLKKFWVFSSWRFLRFLTSSSQSALGWPSPWPTRHTHRPRDITRGGETSSGLLLITERTLSTRQSPPRASGHIFISLHTALLFSLLR